MSCPDEIQLALSGINLSEEEVSELEASLAKNSADLNSRIKLLGKYFLAQMDLENIAEKRIRHIEFVIKHHADSAIAGTPYAQVTESSKYPHLKTLWNKVLKSGKENFQMHLNASKFFCLDDKEFSEKLCLKALKIAPENQNARRHLAQIYRLWEGHEDKAVEHLEILCEVSKERNFSQFNGLPDAYYSAGKIEKAFEAANKLLKLADEYRDNWNYGNAVNNAHTVLGMIAFEKGDILKALKHLSQSSEDIATPQTSSFGPRTELVRLIARAGYHDEALNYLDEAQRLCGYENDRFNELRFEIANGGPANDDEDGTEACEEFVRQHVMHSLRKLDVASRATHLERAIRSTETSIHIYSNFELDGNESLEFQKRRVEKLKGHLRELQLLSEENH